MKYINICVKVLLRTLELIMSSITNTMTRAEKKMYDELLSTMQNRFNKYDVDRAIEHDARVTYDCATKKEFDLKLKLSFDKLLSNKGTKVLYFMVSLQEMINDGIMENMSKAYMGGYASSGMLIDERGHIIITNER